MSLKKIIIVGAIGMVTTVAAAQPVQERQTCRLIDDFPSRTVVVFDHPSRIIDFCSNEPIQTVIGSNMEQWTVVSQEAPRGLARESFFAVTPHSGDSDPNNVLIYTGNGNRYELWLQNANPANEKTRELMDSMKSRLESAKEAAAESYMSLKQKAAEKLQE